MSWPGFLWRIICIGLPRGIALFLGLFTLLNIIGELRAPGFDANLWWINLPANWHLVEQAIMLWSASCLIRFGICQRFALAEKIGIAFTFAVLLVCSIWNAISYQQLIAEGQIQSNSPISFSTLIAACLIIFIYEVLREMPETGRNTIRLCQSTIAVSCVLSGLLFPVAQMACFGVTDYRRNVDVIVVFGAKVHEDGQLSSILEERVLTGCELYHQGLAPQILFSGGPGVGDIHETQGMRRRALELGVPAAAISIDLNGVDTESTAINTLRMGQSQKWDRILAVSQFFHLPRIKLAFHRQGTEVYTVPAKRLYYFRYLPYFMLREVAAWWWYYIRPLF